MITIVEASGRHHEFIAEAQLQMALETENLRLDPATVRLGVGAVLLDVAKGRYYVAEKEGVPVACMLTIPEWSDWRNKTAIWIHSLYVRPEARGRGVYRQMYGYLKAKVEESPEYFALKLYVDKRNTR
ncbi:GNAT family N-acetyltransferase, partial [bacterium]|nr:GNAT family N-acetyltransferase [bacterium]